MSTEEATGRKAKKAQRDAERKKAGKKRKREEAEEKQVDGQDELKNDFISLAGGDETKIAKDSATLSKKRKVAGTTAEQENAAPEDASAPKAKKRRKRANTGNTAQDDHAPKVDDTNSHNDPNGDVRPSSKPSQSRFILFIGNLPYTATDESITSHFKSIQPFTLRHRVDPKTKKSKGFAFLEFENYDRMKTCLKLYHHSTFDPSSAGEGKGENESGGGVGGAEGKKGKKGKDKARRINVELTAGGGGRGDERKEKIKAKNAKLDEERKRRREAEEKEAARREKKGKGKKVTGENAVTAEKEASKQDGEAEDARAEGMQGVHPARLARMKA